MKPRVVIVWMIVITILLAAEAIFLYYKNVQLQHRVNVLPSPPAYSCPPTGWVNCMPILTEKTKKLCTPEAMQWYKANCPNFQGGAL